MLHRIGGRCSQGIPANQNMILTQRELYNFISQAKARGYEFLSIDRLVNNLKMGKNIFKKLVLTFDDGYLDNYTEVFPLLERLECPFCVYVTTQYIDNPCIRPWWYQLEDLLLRLQSVTDPLGNDYSLSSIQEKQHAFLGLRSALMSGENNYEKYVSWIASMLQDNPRRPIHRLFMNWHELKEISKSPFVSIGAHTISHPVLSNLDDQSSLTEIQSSKEKLETRLGVPINHFAYPFGGYAEAKEREYSYCCDLGFISAVTTIPGLPSFRSNFMALPRFFFSPSMTLARLERSLYKSRLRSAFSRLF